MTPRTDHPDSVSNTHRFFHFLLLGCFTAALVFCAPSHAETADAEETLKRAEESTSGPQRLELLLEATRTDPSNPRGWIALSETYALMGHGEEASNALAEALTIIKEMKGKERKELSLAYSLARAWQEYEQADFVEGQKWGEMAVKLDGGQKAHLIHVLNTAALNPSEADIIEGLGVFRPFDTNTNRRRNANWAIKTWMHLNNIEYLPPDIWGYKESTVKYAEKESERSRDLGLIYEANGEGNLAAREYGRFLKYFPIPDGGWLRKMEGPTPGAKPGFPHMPFWVNREGGYVTGSRLAYLTHCYDEMQSATTPEDRGVWAANIVWSGKAATPRYPRRPWIRMWMGAAYLALGMPREAEEELTMARAWFDEFGIEEPELNVLQGHMLLLEKSYTAALPMLEQAAVDYPADASVWGDLGVVRAMKVGRPPAREAFDRALELDPGLGPAWYNRGMLNLRDGQVEAAAADLAKAAEIMPDDEKLLEDLAQVKQKLRVLSR